MPQIIVLYVNVDTVFMLLLNTFKVQHLPNKLTGYSAMNVVTPRIIIVAQVFESHEIKKIAFAAKLEVSSSRGSEFPRRLCDPLPQYDFIMSAVTLPCKYSTSSATSSEVIENLAACS